MYALARDICSEVRKRCQKLWHYKSISKTLFDWANGEAEHTEERTEMKKKQTFCKTKKMRQKLYLDVSITLIVTFDFIRRVHWKRTLAVEVIHSIFGYGPIAFLFYASGMISTIRWCCLVIFGFVEFTLDIVIGMIQVVDGVVVVDILIVLIN